MKRATTPTEQERKRAAKRIRNAIADFQKGHIADAKFAKIVMRHKIGIDMKYFTFDEHAKLLKLCDNAEEHFIKTYPEDDHFDRVGQDRSPYYSPLGKIMQSKAKPMIRKAVRMAHWYIEKRYGNDPFRYDSEFTNFIDEMLKDYIDENFGQSKELKSDMMHEIRDIVGFMQAEDIFYRARFKDFINKFVVEFNARYPNGIELTEHEKHNLALWDRPGGNPDVDRLVPPETQRS